MAFSSARYSAPYYHGAPVPFYAPFPAHGPCGWRPPKQTVPLAVSHAPVFRGQVMSPKAFRSLADQMLAASPVPTTECYPDTDYDSSDAEPDDDTNAHGLTVLLSREEYLRRELSGLYASLCDPKKSLRATKQRVLHVLKVDEQMRSRLLPKGRKMSFWCVVRMTFRLAKQQRPRPPVFWRVQPLWRFRLLAQRLMRRERRANELWVMTSMDLLVRSRMQRRRRRLRLRLRTLFLSYKAQVREQRVLRFRVLAKRALWKSRRVRRRQVLRRFRVLARRGKIRARVRRYLHRRRMRYLKFLLRLVVAALAWMRHTVTDRFARLTRRLAEQNEERVRLEAARVHLLERIAIREAQKRHAQRRWSLLRRFVRSPIMKTIVRKHKWKRVTYVVGIATYWRRFVYDIRVREMTVNHSLTIRAAFRMGNTVDALLCEAINECSQHLNQASAAKKSRRRKLRLVNYLGRAKQLQQAHHHVALMMKRFCFTGMYWIKTFSGNITDEAISAWEKLVCLNFSFHRVNEVAQQFHKPQVAAIVMTVWWMWLDVVVTQRLLLRRLRIAGRLDEFHTRISLSPGRVAHFVELYVWSKRHLLPVELVQNVDPGPKPWAGLATMHCDPTVYCTRVTCLATVIARKMFGPGFRAILFRRWGVVHPDQSIQLALSNSTEPETALLYNYAMENKGSPMPLKVRFGNMCAANERIDNASEVQQADLLEQVTQLQMTSAV